MKNVIWIILVAILIAAIGGAYWYRTNIAAPVELSETPTGPALELIDRLNKINIDVSLFEDTRFTSLAEFPTPSLDGVQKGKINPFALSASAANQ